MNQQIRPVSSVQEPIAVLGMGCRLPGGVESPEQFWQLLAEGREAIAEIPSDRWDLQRHHDPDPRTPLHQHVRRAGLVDGIDQFDPALFGISGREAQCMDPQQRLLLEVCWRAMEAGAQPLEQLRGRSVGVFMGISSADYRALLWASENRYLTPDNEPFILTGNTGSIAANRISYAFDFKGPSFTVDTACSSSLVALHLACESLRRGESELALAGGAQALIHPAIQMSFCKAGLLSPDGRCRSFDAAADGYVRSEGAGAVLLKPLAAALRDGDPIEAVIRGTAVNSDGRSKGLAAPSKKAQIACVQAAYQGSGLSPASAQLVEAHGTGTRQGDPIELRALGAVLGQERPSTDPCLLGSVKTNVGHSETAAGITGFIKAVLCLRQRMVPASLHYSRPNPSVDLPALGLKVSTQLQPFPKPDQELVVSVSSFGFGGTNSHAVLSSAPVQPSQPSISSLSAPSLHLLWLSARNEEALDLLRAQTADWLEAHAAVSLQDLCASIQLRRSQCPHALGLIASSAEHLVRQLRGQDPAAWTGVVASRGAGGLPETLKDLKQQTLAEGAVGFEQLQKLVQALAQGAPMDWLAWHQGASWHQLRPPGHPFLRSRFWWTPRDQGRDQVKASLWLDHVGFGSSVTAEQSGLALQKLDLPGAAEHWQTELDPADARDLPDHALCGYPLFAAAGYLALFLDWLNDQQQPLQCADLNLDRPLWLNAGSVQLQAVRDGDAFSFHARSPQAEDGGSWQLHGQLRLTTAAEQPIQPLQALAFDDGAELDITNFYRSLKSLGLDYGSCYRALVALQANVKGAEALLQRPEAAPDRSLIDGCFQLVAAVLAQTHADGQLLLPVGVEQMQMLRWPLPDQLRCRLQVRPEDHSQGAEGSRAHVTADLDVLDLSGDFLGAIRGLQFRRLTRTLLELMLPEDSSRPAAQLLEEIWQPLAAHALSDWSPGAAEPITLIAMGPLPDAVREWSAQQAITPFELDSQADPQSVTAALVQQLQALPLSQPRQVLLWMPALASPAANAVQAAVRSLAQDCSAWRCSTITASPSALAGGLSSAEWQQLLATTAGDAEVRWCGSDRIETRSLQPIDQERFRMLSDGTGRLEGLLKSPLPLARLLPGELELAVEATGLNFRDVLNALGLLQSHNQSLGLRANAQLPFGGEAVGRVVAVGPGVDSSLVGQRMLAALTLGSLASHVTCRAMLCVPWPEELDPVLGASLSTAYLTAEHGLEQLARLQAGEMVLIHAAAGGVGQAAVQVALRCGARILATASEGKQAGLLEQGVEAVFDSRSTDFADQVLKHTEGRGVDVVLNSLKGEWVDASFHALASGGRFVELGKLEIWGDQQVRERRPDVSYFRFDLLEVAARDPQPLRQRLLRLVAAAQDQTLPALPVSAFAVEQCKDAFRRMAQGKHVGKLVITLPSHAPPCAIRTDGTYLVVGAFGGIGQRLQSWLLDRGARSLLLVGRRLPAPGSETAEWLDRLRSQGVQVEPLCWDDLPQALAELPQGLPLRGVFHAAGALKDQRVGEIELTSLNAVFEAKFGPQQQLDKLQKLQPAAFQHLDFQVMFSSIAAALGSPGQLVYGAANGAVESSCRNADSEGPVQLAIQWGPWAGSGMAAGLERRFESVGLHLLAEDEAMSSLELLLQRGRSGVVTVMAADWPRLVSQALPRQAAWFRSLIHELPGRSEAQVRAQLEALAADQRRPWLLSTLQQLLVGVMEEPEAQLDAQASLFDLGLDSLMAAEFAAEVQQALGWRLDLAAFSDAPCLDDLASMALERLLPDGSAAAPEELDLDQEAQLDESWSLPEGPSVEAPGERVLLTGASGFLGAYLLAGQLRQWPDLRVRCLVRAASEQQGMERLEQNLRRYGLWQQTWQDRLEVVLGDLAQPRLGLDADQFAALGRGIGGILHNGAQLSQMASYAQLAATNVGGTRELLRLAAADTPKRFALISSVAVFEADACRDQLIQEEDPLEDWQGIQLGYSQTKWVTDRMVRCASAAGLPVSIYRPPLIAGPSCGSAWHQGDLLQRLLQGCLALGASPDLAWELDVVPVDYVADAVSALAWSDEAKGRAFHLQHPEPLLLTTLLRQLTDGMDGWRVLPMQEWIAEIERSSGNPLQPLLPFLQQSWGDDGLTYPERNCVGQRARPSCVFTAQVLEAHGVRCPPWHQLIGPWASVLLQQEQMAR